LLPAVSVIRSDDEALLAEVAADRRLAKLGLQRIAPTVLSCAVPLETALTRLRELGYFPVPDQPGPRPDQPGPRPDQPGPRPEPRPAEAGERRPPLRTAEDRAQQATPPEPGAVARGLLERRDTGLPAPSSEIAHELALSAAQLSAVEIDWLVAAVEDGGRVRIEYRSSAGALTRRVIDDPDLDGGLLYAWCELRQDERVFSPSRILSVAPVP
jgi:hypothetical protein